MNIKIIALIIIASSVFFGCALPSETAMRSYKERQMSDYRVRNKQIALALGTRKIDFPPRKVLKGIIIAMSDNNMAVINLDKDVGFVIAEGKGFLTEEEGMRICNDVAKSETPKLPYGWKTTCKSGGDDSIKLTGTVDTKDGKTSVVKIGISSSNTTYINGLNKERIAEYNDLAPEFTQREYELFWQALDRALFVQENTQ